MQTVAVSSCRLLCDFRFFIGVARQCIFTSACTHTVCAALGSLDSVWRVHISFLGRLCNFWVGAPGQPLCILASILVHLHIVNKSGTLCSFFPSAYEPRCLPCFSASVPLLFSGGCRNSPAHCWKSTSPRLSPPWYLLWSTL